MSTFQIDPTVLAKLAPLFGSQQPPQPTTLPPIAPQPNISGMSLAKIPITMDAQNGQLPTLPSPAIQNPQLLADTNKLSYLRNSGSGISQIGNDVDAQGNKTSNHPGFWKTLGKVGATIGDTALQLAAPGLERLIPGTLGHNLMLQGLQQGIVTNDQANAEAQGKLAQQTAQLGLTGAQTAYAAARPDIEQSKIDQRQTAVQERVGQAAAARGQKVSWDENGIPTFTDDVDSEAYHDHQALSMMHEATAEKSKIQSDIAKNHFIPGTPEFEEAQRKLAQVDKRMQVAMQSLTLRAQGLKLRQNDQNANFYGLGPDGQPLPNAPQYTDEAGNVTTGGLKGAPLASRQQAKVGTFNDLVGSVSHLRNAIQAYEAEGGDMSDPTLTAAATDPHSVVGKVIQGKLVTGGLSPAALTLLNAQRQTMEQAGILRSTTGGTSSEAGAQRILAVVPQFGSDTNDSARSKLDEQEGVLARLKPSLTAIAGGQHVHAGNQTPRAGTPTGPAHSLATAMALPFNAGKTAEQVTADLQAHGYKVVP